MSTLAENPAPMLNNVKKVKISFYDPFSVYPKLQQDLESKLPLTNLHWKASEKSPLRSIPCLDAEFVEEIPKNIRSAPLIKTIDEQMQKRLPKDPSSMLKRASTIAKTGSQESQPIPEELSFDASATSVNSIDEVDEAALTDLISSINDSYLKIMFFEAQSIEQYKQNVRPFITEWFKQSVDSSKLPTDWLLVFYIPKGGKDDYTTAFKYGLLDRIKMDFSNHKNASFLDDSASASLNNNVNHLKILKIKHDYASTSESNQAWNSLIISLKTGILNTFTERVNFFDYKIGKFINSFTPTNEVKMSSKNGSLVSKVDNGPNFHAEMNIGLYFLLNENLGILYHDLSLYEDSLIQYDNLEKIFKFYLRKHADSNLDIRFINSIGFQDNLDENLFYFNIYKSLQDSSFNAGPERAPGLTVSAYEQIAPKIFESLTSFNNIIFEDLRKKILSNEISYFELRNYFFLKGVTLINSIIFNNFSQLSSTPSVNSVYIYDLLKRLKSFIVEINFEILNFNKGTESPDYFKLIEYCFTMIDNYLLFINEYFFKPPQKLASNDSKLPPLGNKSHLVYSKSKEINDTIGELRLIQRFFLVVLGKFYGYQLDSVFVDRLVNLKFSQYIDEKVAKKEYLQFDHPLLTRIFSSFDSFNIFFKYLTECAIGNFNISDKPRNVDILSIDIALLNYQIGNYNDSLTVLLNCPNFYNEQGWEFIGFYLLKVFISCLEKVLDEQENELRVVETKAKEDDKGNEDIERLKETIRHNKTQLFRSYLDLLSTLIDSSTPAATRMTEISLNSSDAKVSSNSNFINNNLESINKYLTDTKQIDKVISQMIKLKEEVSLEYELDKIFQFKVCPFVVSYEDNLYSVELEINNFLLLSAGNSQGFNFDTIELTLQNMVNKDELVMFMLDKESDGAEGQENKFYLQKGKNKVFLSTRHIISGRFVVKGLNIKFGGITLVKNHIYTKRTLLGEEERYGSIPDEANAIAENYDEELVYESKEILLIHPYVNNLYFVLQNPLELNLDYKQFLVQINVGDFEIENGVLEFSSTSDAFQLIGNDLKAILKNRVPKNSKTGDFDYDDDTLFDESSVAPVEISSENNGEESSITNSVDNNETNNQKIIFKIGKLAKNSIVDVIIPYTMSDIKVSGSSSENKNFINLKTKMTYVSNNKEHSLVSYQDLSTALSIAVSVQDTFKSQNLFSKFSVGTANLAHPVRILSTDLLPNDSYKTSTALRPSPLIAFGEQPASFFFKIEPRNNNYITKSNDSLKLIVKYRNLGEEIFESIWKHFKETYLLNQGNETQKNHIRKYILLLKDYLFKLLRFDLNEYALFNKVKVKHFNIYEFAELFTHFFPEDRSKYLDIFKKFVNSLKNNQSGLPIESFTYGNSIDHYDSKEVKDNEQKISKYFSSINRELFINVPIPLVHVVHNVSLEFEQKGQYVVGEPIESNFKIQSLINWRGAEPPKDSDLTEGGANGTKAFKKKRVLFKDPNEDLALENFQVDFVGPQDNWLISGKKKFQFSVDKEGGENGSTIINQSEKELFLVPLKIGKLILPKIEIHSLNNHLNDEFTMEIDYKNSSQTVLVVPNLDRVTFAF